MKPSAWVITAVLTVLGLVAGWFFGLDPAHAVVLVGAGLTAGIANGVLESVDAPRPALAPLPRPVTGLADLQALEFSLSASEPGTRAILETHTIARAVVAARGSAPVPTTLAAFAAGPVPAELGHRELRTIIDDLEEVMLHRDPPVPTRRTHDEP
ncbi:hypothetical protein E8P82_09215 [Arthrobacter echini]|uniref:Uncharacterized protein n=1 Tax=Arthrobacter echini TaxID=1529066 RepID=A0A4S5E403_9MICC|nr:hypothetical protein [Arthrobacter echini]THJ66176.1 hypothetical protein E8P82_09215 [Arthrobacter echini]